MMEAFYKQGGGYTGKDCIKAMKKESLSWR